ncbi:MAG: MurR/RpiR family transcriptional regulator [Bacillota bacterium]
MKRVRPSTNDAGKSELETRIRQAYPRLSPAKKKIAEWILQNTDESAFHSAVMIARAVGVSESVVTRFSSDLGYSGFRELREANQHILRGRLEVVDRLRHSLAQDSRGADDGLRSFEQNLRNIRETMANVRREDLGRAAELIVKADRIGLVGLRSAVAPVLVLHTFLNEILGNARLITPGLGDVFDYLRFWGSKDLIIGASFLMSSNFTLDVMNFAKERNCKIIAITDNPVAPIARAADLTFVVRTQGVFISYSAAMALVDAILYKVTTKVKHKSLDLATETETLLKTYFGSRAGTRDDKTPIE